MATFNFNGGVIGNNNKFSLDDISIVNGKFTIILDGNIIVDNKAVSIKIDNQTIVINTIEL